MTFFNQNSTGIKFPFQAREKTPEASWKKSQSRSLGPLFIPGINDPKKPEMGREERLRKIREFPERGKGHGIKKLGMDSLGLK